MNWWEGRDESEEYARGKLIVERLREKYDREVCERIDKRRAGIIPPLVLDRIENGKEVWVEGKRHDGSVRRRGISRKAGK